MLLLIINILTFLPDTFSFKVQVRKKLTLFIHKILRSLLNLFCMLKIIYGFFLEESATNYCNRIQYLSHGKSNKKETLQIAACNLLGTNGKFKGVYSVTAIARNEIDHDILCNERRSFDLREGNEWIAERRPRGNVVNEGESAHEKGSNGCSLNYTAST